MGYKHTPNLKYLFRPLDNNSYRRYLYTRGYLISDVQYTVREDWVKIDLPQGLFFTCDPLNCYSLSLQHGSFVLLMGIAMDTIDWHMDLQKISDTLLNLLLSHNTDREAFLDYIDYLCGRFLILYSDQNGIPCLMQDATGMRTCFYHKDRCMAASHYRIIADIIGEPPSEYMNKYVELDPQPWFLPGNTTPYKNIYALVPNNELKFDQMRMRRFWPRKPKQDITVHEAVEFVTESLQKQMEILTDHYKVMLSLTKGNDSRISLAASEKVRDKMIFFTSYDGDREQYKDAVFASDFAKELDLKYIFIDASDKARTSEELREIAFKNYYHSYMYSSIGQYREQLPADGLFLRSNLIEIVRANDYFCTLPSKCSYRDMAYRIYHDNADDPFVDKAYKNWFTETSVDELLDYPIGEMMYWEYRMGLWLNPAALLRDDLVADTYMLFNCRKILDMCLCMPNYYKQKNVIVYECIERLWPDLLKYIPNTDYTLNDYFIRDNSKLIELTESRISFHTTSYGENGCYSHIGRYQGIWGFGGNVCKAGDYCELKIPIAIREHGKYIIQISLFNSSECHLTNNDIRFKIIIDGSDVLNQSLREFQDKINQINIVNQYKEKCVSEISIRLYARADYRAELNGNCGTLRLDSVSLNRQLDFSPVKSPYALSTAMLLSKVHSDHRITWPDNVYTKLKGKKYQWPRLYKVYKFFTSSCRK